MPKIDKYKQLDDIFSKANKYKDEDDDSSYNKLNKTIKVCPDCETHLYLMWSAFNDNTTDCGSCGSNFEEDELKEVDREELI